MTQSNDANYALDMGTSPTKAVLKDYYLRSKAVLAAARTEADIVYGDHPLQKFSVAWPAEQAGTRLAVLFFHGGWWKAGNKEDRMFLAEALPGDGVAYVSVGYPLMPDARLRTLADSATLAVDAVVKHLESVVGRRVPIVLAGNSAGAHLAAYATGTLAGTEHDAAAHGIVGMRAKKPEEVDGLIKAMLATKGPVIADIWVDKNENVYPMIPAGAAHNEIVLGPDGRNDGKLDKNQV